MNAWKIKENSDGDYSYSTLEGPNGQEFSLTEPEDRTWGRDLRGVVTKLNELEAEVA